MADKLSVALSGPKLDGKTYHADLSQSSDTGFLAAEMMGKATYDVMTAYPIVWEDPGAGGGLQAQPPGAAGHMLTFPDGKGGTFQMSVFDYWWWIQQAPKIMDLIRRALAGDLPPEGIATPVIPISALLQFYGVVQRRTAAAAGSGGGNPEAARPER